MQKSRYEDRLLRPAAVSYVWDTVLEGVMTNVENRVSRTENLAFYQVELAVSSRQSTRGKPYGFTYQYTLAGGQVWWLNADESGRWSSSPPLELSAGEQSDTTYCIGC